MIVTLLLTGRATPYIHNGVINVGDENSYVSKMTLCIHLCSFPISLQAVPQYGVLSRCSIGLMLWESENSGQVCYKTIVMKFSN